jgi:hypothetical protein
MLARVSLQRHQDNDENNRTEVYLPSRKNRWTHCTVDISGFPLLDQVKAVVYGVFDRNANHLNSLTLSNPIEPAKGLCLYGGVPCCGLVYMPSRASLGCGIHLHQRSTSTVFVAAVKSRPVPPAFSEDIRIRIVGSSRNFLTSSPLVRGFVLPVSFEKCTTCQ